MFRVFTGLGLAVIVCALGAPRADAAVYMARSGSVADIGGAGGAIDLHALDGLTLFDLIYDPTLDAIGGEAGRWTATVSILDAAEADFSILSLDFSVSLSVRTAGAPFTDLVLSYELLSPLAPFSVIGTVGLNAHGDAAPDGLADLGFGVAVWAEGDPGLGAIPLGPRVDPDPDGASGGEIVITGDVTLIPRGPLVATPIPASGALLLGALAGIAGLRRRRG